LPPMFCRRQYSFDAANILSVRVFCWRQHFVVPNILSTPTFCCRQCFVGANILLTQPIFCRRCAAYGTFRYFELCSICLREGLCRSKPATNPWNKHNNTTVAISTISKPYWTVFCRIKWAVQVWES
jgi:hypothetical protein